MWLMDKVIKMKKGGLFDVSLLIIFSLLFFKIFPRKKRRIAIDTKGGLRKPSAKLLLNLPDSLILWYMGRNCQPLYTMGSSCLLELCSFRACRCPRPAGSPSTRLPLGFLLSQVSWLPHWVINTKPNLSGDNLHYGFSFWIEKKCYKMSLKILEEWLSIFLCFSISLANLRS